LRAARFGAPLFFWRKIPASCPPTPQAFALRERSAIDVCATFGWAGYCPPPTIK
jgi:hypothetical protein